MTKIELFIKGAEAEAEVDGPLTGGMVGAQVEIRYNSAWDGLSKTLVCRSCVDGTPVQDVRTVANVGLQATVAHEVMIPGRTLYLGVEGRNADGTVVFPTIWACCGTIHPGANADADPTVAATPEAWEQVLLQMGSLGDLNTDQKGTLVAAINEVFAANLLPNTAIPTKVSQLENDAGYAKCEDIPEHTWESLADKPFGEVEAEAKGETLARNQPVEPDFKQCWKLCDDTPTLADLEDLTTITLNEDVMGVDVVSVFEQDDGIMIATPTINLYVAPFDGATVGYGGPFPSAGIWCDWLNDMTDWTIGISVMGYEFTTTEVVTKKLDEKYLPELTTEEWVFELADGATVTKRVVVK